MISLRGQLRQTKVYDPQPVILVDDTVLRLQVSVDDFVGVNVMQAAKNHVHDAPDLVFGEQSLQILGLISFNDLLLLLDNIMKFRGALYILHHDVHVAIVFIRFHVLDDIRVIKHGEDSDLVSRQCNRLLVKSLLDQDLDCVLASRVRSGLEQINGTEVALA